MSSPAPLPYGVHDSACRAFHDRPWNVQHVVKWLREGGQVDALCPTTTRDGRATAETLLHAAAGSGHLAMVKELLERGASVDLQTSLGCTALMDAASGGHPSIVLVLLQHSASIELLDIDGVAALMQAANRGREACVKALLRAKANPCLLYTSPSPRDQRGSRMPSSA